VGTDPSDAFLQRNDDVEHPLIEQLVAQIEKLDLVVAEDLCGAASGRFLFLIDRRIELVVVRAFADDAHCDVVAGLDVFRDRRARTEDFIVHVSCNDKNAHVRTGNRGTGSLCRSAGRRRRTEQRARRRTCAADEAETPTYWAM